MAYQLVFKRYAPFESFGGGFHGDARATSSLTGSARTWGIVRFDVSSGEVLGVGRSGVSYHVSIPSLKKTGKTKCTISNVLSGSGSLSFTAYTEGALPLIPGAPDIDTFVDLKVSETDHGLQVKGKVRGDNFPNAEVFIFPEPKEGEVPTAKAVWHFKTTGGQHTGPMTRLTGAHSGQVLGEFSCLVK